MERETTEFESSGHKIVAYTFITAAEARDAKRALFDGITVEAPDVGMPTTKPKIPLSNTESYMHAQLMACVFTVDGKPAAQVIEQLPSDEYDALVTDCRDHLPRVFLVKAKTLDTHSPSSTN